MKRKVVSVLSILTSAALLLFAGCTEDLPRNEDLSQGKHLKNGIIDSPVDGRGSKVVFSRSGPDLDLWAMNIDGTNLTRLTYGNCRPNFKDISPDGQKVVFRANKNNNSDIYIVNIDGSGFQRITYFAGNDRDPRFTQDGHKIVFSSQRNDIDLEVYSMNLDGSELEQLTYLGGWNSCPCISKNGRELLFVRSIMDICDIYKMDLITGDTVRLTFDGRTKLLPSWSNDGKKILFAARFGPVLPPPNPSPPYDIYVMDADGSNIKNLTEYPGEDKAPCWSPDGRHIIFQRKPFDGGKIQLYVMKADGSDDPVQITEELTNRWPAWGPGRLD